MPTFTSHQIRNLLAADPRDPAQRAKITALRILAEQARRHGDGTVNAQAEAVLGIADQLLSTPLGTPPPQVPVSPFVTTRARPAGLDQHGDIVDRERALSAADVAWLQRLPEDPKALSDADVKALAQLRAECRGESDARLLDSICAPVIAYHEEIAAAALAKREQWESQPVPKAPRAVRDLLPHALEPVVRAEAPEGLTDADIRNRTSDLAAELADGRVARFVGEP